MALVNNGTSVEMGTALLPAGYTKPTVTKFVDPTYDSEMLSLSVLKSTVENATATTTFTNILDDAAIGITKQVSDLVTANFDTVGNTVTVYADLVSVRTNLTVGADLYGNVVPSYLCSVMYYVKVS